MKVWNTKPIKTRQYTTFPVKSIPIPRTRHFYEDFIGPPKIQLNSHRNILIPSPSKLCMVFLPLPQRVTTKKEPRSKP